jgi:hypothetical protein
MRKLLVTCACGQQMQVPRSAIGKVGMCPTCGRTTRITPQNTSPLQRRPPFETRSTWGPGRTEPPETAKQRFGQAVDLYYQGRYGEALAIFDALLREFPGNPDIEHGRAQCLKAVNRPALPPPDPSAAHTQAELSEDLVKRVVLEKLLYTSNELVQIQAADIAAKILGMYDRKRRTEGEDTASEKPEGAAPTAQDVLGALGDKITPFREGLTRRADDEPHREDRRRM